MSIDRAEVDRIARLARLRLNEEQAQAMLTHMRNILGWVDELSTLNLEGVEPCVFATGGDPPSTPEGRGRTAQWAVRSGGTPLREDQVRPSLSLEQALHDAPDRDGPYFRVPDVLPGEEEGA